MESRSSGGDVLAGPTKGAELSHGERIERQEGEGGRENEAIRDVAGGTGVHEAELLERLRDPEETEFTGFLQTARVGLLGRQLRQEGRTRRAIRTAVQLAQVRRDGDLHMVYTYKGFAYGRSATG